MNNPIALIFGNGQDTAYLSKFLLEKNYQVVVATRRSGSSNNWRMKELKIDNNPNLIFEWCDITEGSRVNEIVNKYKPSECYNLAAMSFVQSSFDHPVSSSFVNFNGHLNILESIKYYSPKTKVYFAASSEMYGKVQEVPQTEKTPFYPRSPYAVSKLAAYWIGVNYRESHSLYICNGILFNHESKFRGEEFITRKVTKKVAEIKFKIEAGLPFTPLIVGNVESKRDWGSAEDYVRGMWLMLQHSIPDDYVLATGKTYSIKEFITKAFQYVDIEIKWMGEGHGIFAVDKNNNVIVKTDEKFYRPCEVDLLIGDANKAKKVLNWEPKITLDELIADMIDADIKRLSY
jgi:GDPmannose 4,6-dehydratase